MARGLAQRSHLRLDRVEELTDGDRRARGGRIEDALRAARADIITWSAKDAGIEDVTQCGLRGSPTWAGLANAAALLIANAYGPDHPKIDHAVVTRWTDQLRADGADQRDDGAVDLLRHDDGIGDGQDAGRDPHRTEAEINVRCRVRGHDGLPPQARRHA